MSRLLTVRIGVLALILAVALFAAFQPAHATSRGEALRACRDWRTETREDGRPFASYIDCANYIQRGGRFGRFADLVPDVDCAPLGPGQASCSINVRNDGEAPASFTPNDTLLNLFFFVSPLPGAAGSTTITLNGYGFAAAVLPPGAVTGMGVRPPAFTLQPGESTATSTGTITFESSISGAEHLQLEVIVDPDDVVFESNESNNSHQEEFETGVAQTLVTVKEPAAASEAAATSSRRR